MTIDDERASTRTTILIAIVLVILVAMALIGSVAG